MAYAAIADAKKILKEDYFTYPANVDDEEEFASSYIDGRLAGHYPLPFDDTSQYSAVPTQIKWIAAHLIAYKLWDQVVPLEGQNDDTAAARWKKLADDWLDRLRDREELLVLDDGTVIDFSDSSIRFYPSGTRDKADSDDNTPFSTRAQAHNW